VGSDKRPPSYNFVSIFAPTWWFETSMLPPQKFDIAPSFVNLKQLMSRKYSHLGLWNLTFSWQNGWHIQHLLDTKCSAAWGIKSDLACLRGIRRSAKSKAWYMRRSGRGATRRGETNQSDKTSLLSQSRRVQVSNVPSHSPHPEAQVSSEI